MKWLPQNGIKDIQWAKASNDIRRPTISELRRLIRNPQDPIGRSCTVDKLSDLYDGLYTLVGGTKLKKYLEECLKKESNQDVRLVMLSLAVRHSAQAGKDLIENTMRMVLKADDEKKD